MEAVKHVICMGFLALGRLTASAAPILSQPVPLPPLKLATPAPYRLSLSAFNVGSDAPRIHVTITNISAYTLGFGLDTAAFTRFMVEYRSDMTPLSRWKTLKANLQQAPDINSLGRLSRTRTSTYSVIITILPGQRYEANDVLVDFPAPEGFYRITAVRAPEMDELSGSAGSYVLVRKFDLDVRSNSVVVRCVLDGFIEVSP